MTATPAGAQGVLAQLQQLDAAAQAANSRYQIANGKLRVVQHELSQNKQALGVARLNLASARRTLAQRLVAIYTSQDQQSSLAVILGAKSLNDLISRMETVSTMTKQDSSLILQVTSYQRTMLLHRKLLHEARRSVGRLVLASAAAKHTVDAKLAAEQRLYDSVRSRLAQLEAQQRLNQAAAVRQASQSTPPVLGCGVTCGSVPGDRYSAAVGIAERYLGVPYSWGGATPSGFDCSGLVMYVYEQLGVQLPHYTVSQYNFPDAVHVSRSQLEPGDLVFFASLGHVGIYIGNNEFIHAPHQGASVEIDAMTGWYSSEYAGATRILGP